MQSLRKYTISSNIMHIGEARKWQTRNW